MKILKSHLVLSILFSVFLYPAIVVAEFSEKNTEKFSKEVSKKAIANTTLESYSIGVIKDGVLHLNATEAAAILDRHSDIIVLDVRTPKEHVSGNVRPGLNIDYYADDFKAQLAVLDKDQRYLVHCRSGVRSGRTLPLMQELGFAHVIHLDGGILAWQALRE